MSKKIKLKFSSPWDSAADNNARVLYNWGKLPKCFKLTTGDDYDYLIVLNHSNEVFLTQRKEYS